MRPRVMILAAGTLLCSCAAQSLADERQELVDLYGQVVALKRAGKLRDATSLADTLARRAETVFQGQPLDIAMCQSELGELYWRRGLYAEAEGPFKRALQIRQQALGPDDAKVADSLNNLAVLYQAQGRLDDAEPLLVKALAITTKARGNDHPDVAVRLNNLAIVYRNQGRLSEAEPMYRRSLAIREKALGPNHQDVAQTLDNLALFFTKQGRYAEAEPLARRALQIWEQARGGDDVDVAICLNNLAMIYDNQRRFAEAVPLYQRALAIYEKAGGEDHPAVAASLDNLALIHMAQGRYDEAERLNKRSLAIWEKSIGRHHREFGVCLNNLAAIYESQGRIADAQQLYTRGLQVAEQDMGRNHPELATGLNNMAAVLVKQHHNAEALPHVERAISLKDRGAVPAQLAIAFRLRARIRWDEGRQKDAIEDLNQALDLAEQQRAQTSGAERERATAFAEFSSYYEQMVQWQREIQNVGGAMMAAERSRARSLVDQLATANIDLLAGLPEAEADALRRRDAAAKLHLAQVERRAEKDRTDAVEHELVAARRELVDAYSAIRNASPAYRQLVGGDFKPASLDEIQSKLAGGDGLLLEYLLGDQAGYAIIIPPMGEKPRVESLVLDKEQAGRLGVDAGPLTAKRMGEILANKSETGVLQQLRSGSNAEAASERLAVLWTVLVPQAERKLLIDGELKRWIVVPDASLAAFPFETLVVEPGKNPRYLLDVAPPLVNTPSATLLLNLREASASPGKGVLSVGDAVYGGSSSTDDRGAGALAILTARSRYAGLHGDLKPLPFTGIESQWVVDVFKQAGISAGRLEKQDAREASVRKYAPGNEVLHLACHGLVDQSYGNLFGALALTPGPQGSADPTDDGFLTLAEVYSMNLKGTQLAILSACDTNYGPQQRGEGTWSLSRGFLVAGAKRVVASNWLVDDEAAASLISVFCGALAKGEKAGAVDYAESLHAAKKWVRKQDKWKSPYYWGTFVLIGPN